MVHIHHSCLSLYNQGIHHIVSSSSWIYHLRHWNRFRDLTLKILDCYCDDRAIDHEKLIHSLDSHGWLVGCVAVVKGEVVVDDDAGHGLEVGEVKHVTEPNDGDLHVCDVERHVEADGSDLGDGESFEFVVRCQGARIERRTEALGRNWTDDHLIDLVPN